MNLQKLFQGRLNRSNFLLGFIAAVIFFTLVSKWLDQSDFIEGVLWIIGVVFGISIYIRRLHDLGKSGWWALVAAVPIVNFFFLFWLVLTEGMNKKNEYGPVPAKKIKFPQDILVMK